MTTVVLNRIPLDLVPYDAVLEELGSDVAVLADARSAPPAAVERLRRAFRQVSLVEGYESTGRLERAVLDLAAETPIRRIVAPSELDLLRAARLREVLGVPGQTYESALAYRDKVVMKQRVRAAGLSVPRFAAVHEPSDVVAFVRSHGLPAVLKPRLGAGSVGIQLLRSAEDVRAALETRFFAEEPGVSTLEIEELVDGEMFHVNGFVRDGAVVAIWPSRYVNDCRKFIDGLPQGSFTLEAGDPDAERLCDFTRQVLRALPTPETTAFHAEVWLRPDGTSTLCEIASRVGGPEVPAQFEVAFGVDLRAAFLRGQAGLPVPIEGPAARPRVVAGELLLPLRRGRLLEAPAACSLEGVVSYELTAEAGREYEGPRDINDYVASVVLRADDEAAMRARIDGVIAWFEGSCRWG